MTEEEALIKSIAHWERLRDGTQGPKEGPFSSDCALCTRAKEEFREQEEEDDRCEFCPLAEYVGALGCNKTPFNKAFDAWQDDDEKAFKEAAAEVIVLLNRVYKWV